MAQLELRDVRKSFGSAEVIKGISLTIADGEFVSFVGPSGCGKSTLLRMIAGLETITSGEIAIDGAIANDRPPKARGIAMVFQSYALYPHKTVRQNMAFGLKVAGLPRAEIEAKVDKAAAILQIAPLLDRKPAQLSGGQRQRVAIGRAIVRDPKVFLFDEPLSNLDAGLRVSMRMEVARLHAELGATMAYVTHDQVEAMTLSDRIVVLDGGRARQIGSPMELYHRPADMFVAGFIGSPKMNFIPVTLAEAGPQTAQVRIAGLDPVAVPARAEALSAGSHATLGIRPEHLTVDRVGPIEGRVRVVERLGNETIVDVSAGGKTELIARIDPLLPVKVGDPIRLGFKSEHVHLFDGDGRSLKPAAIDMETA